MALSGEYEYKAQVEIIHGGYDGEDKGAIPTDDDWHKTDKETGSATYTYYYTDSNTPDAWPGWQKNEQSSQVRINATDSWSVKIDNDNNLIVTVNTVINWVRRENIRGNPNYVSNHGRDIKLARNIEGAPFWSVNNDNIGYEHDLAGRINVITETFTLKPGQSNSRGSFWIYNHTSGLPNLEIYTDSMWGGISFRNILPPDYRPGATFNGLAWRCNNNSKGACHIWNGSSWQEMRTQDGHVGSGNPPLAFNGSYLNQYKIPNQ